jgi:hypothetical protein
MSNGSFSRFAPSPQKKTLPVLRNFACEPEAEYYNEVTCPSLSPYRYYIDFHIFPPGVRRLSERQAWKIPPSASSLMTPKPTSMRLSVLDGGRCVHLYERGLIAAKGERSKAVKYEHEGLNNDMVIKLDDLRIIWLEILTGVDETLTYCS